MFNWEGEWDWAQQFDPGRECSFVTFIVDKLPNSPPQTS